MRRTTRLQLDQSVRTVDREDLRAYRTITQYRRYVIVPALVAPAGGVSDSVTTVRREAAYVICVGRAVAPHGRRGAAGAVNRKKP